MAANSNIFAMIVVWLKERALRPAYRAWLWLLKWAQVLKPCRFAVIMVVAVAAMLLFVPQGRDLLRGLFERAQGSEAQYWPLFLFVVAAFLWSTYSWYWSRLMLMLEFPDVPRDEPDLRTFRTQAPRYTGFAAAAIISAALFKVSFEYADTSDAPQLLRFCAALALVGAFVFLYLVSKRREWTLATYDRLRKTTLMQKSFAAPLLGLLNVSSSKDVEYGVLRLRDLPRGVKTIAALTLLLELCLFCIFAFKLQSTAPIIGPAAIMLFGASGWIAFGSLCDFVGLKLRFPVMTALFVLAVLCSFLNDNHGVRTLAQPPSPGFHSRDVKSALKEWYARQRERPSPDGTYPLFIVDAEGGGIRAAYWTATVLTQIQDKNPSFADQLFAMSGVSGGSLGTAVFTALLADSPVANGFHCDVRGNGLGGSKPLKSTAEKVLSEDFLAPVVGAMLYPDLIQRILPVGVESFDRGRALELAWERAWRRHSGNDRFAEPLDYLWRDQADRWMPVLFLNSTWVETGKRLIASNLKLTPDEFNDVEDLNEFYRERSVPLSSAVHLSARFTYVSPAGALKKGNEIYGRAVDGGYFENSGATTALEVLLTLGQLADEEKSAKWEMVRPVVIHISNEPAKAPSNNQGHGNTKIHLDTALTDQATRPLGGLNEVLSPPLTLLNTRSARGAYASETLKWHVEESNFLHFGLCRSEKEIPLGWVLSEASRKEMDSQLNSYGKCTAFDNPKNLESISRILKMRHTGI